MKVVGGAWGGHSEHEAAGDDGKGRVRCGRTDIVDGAGSGNVRVREGTLC